MNHVHTQLDTNIHRWVYIHTQKLFVRNNYQYITNHTTTYTHTKENLETHIYKNKEKK